MFGTNSQVLASAAKYDIDEDTLAKEIEQLGLPHENARAILRPYRESKAALRAKFASDTYVQVRAIGQCRSQLLRSTSQGNQMLQNPIQRAQRQ